MRDAAVGDHVVAWCKAVGITSADDDAAAAEAGGADGGEGEIGAVGANGAGGG